MVARPHRLAWPRTLPFQGSNTGSNPVGDTTFEGGLDEASESVSRTPEPAQAEGWTLCPRHSSSKGPANSSGVMLSPPETWFSNPHPPEAAPVQSNLSKARCRRRRVTNDVRL